MHMPGLSPLFSGLNVYSRSWLEPVLPPGTKETMGVFKMSFSRDLRMVWGCQCRWAPIMRSDFPFETGLLFHMLSIQNSLPLLLLDSNNHSLELYYQDRCSSGSGNLICTCNGSSC